MATVSSQKTLVDLPADVLRIIFHRVPSSVRSFRISCRRAHTIFPSFQLLSLHDDLVIFCQQGHLSLLKYYFTRRPSLTHFLFIVEPNCDLMQWALQNNHRHVVEYLCLVNHPLFSYHAETAAELGHFDLIVLLKRYQCPIGHNIGDFIGKYGTAEIARQIDPEINWPYFWYRAAASTGNFDILHWLRETTTPCLAAYHKIAISNGQVETVKWLHQNGCPISREMYFLARAQNQTEIIDWLTQLGYNPT